VAKITAAHPDLLILPYADSWQVPILTLARQQNSSKFVRGNDLFPALNSGSATASNFFFDTNLPSQFNPTPAMQSFINTYQSFTGTKVTPTTYFDYVFSSYPEVFLLAQAMEEAGSVTDEAAILSHMRGATMTTAGGFMPTMTFNAQGQISSYDEQCTITTGGLPAMKCQGYSAGAG
jgi:branched-chain amino acid transport system substrate-binding protein